MPISRIEAGNAFSNGEWWGLDAGTGPFSRGNVATGAPVRDGTEVLWQNFLNQKGQRAQIRDRAQGGTFRNSFQSVRFWFHDALTSASGPNWCPLVDFGPASNAVGLYGVDGLITSNKVTQVRVSIGATVATGVAKTSNAWHYIEAEFGYNAGAGCRWWLDGVAQTSITTGAITPQPQSRIGTLSVVFATGDLYWEDVVYWDDAGIGTSLYASNPTVAMLYATADSAIGNWVGGAGGVTNLYQALQISVGKAIASETNTSQIKNVTAAASSSYDATMTTYTAAGIPSYAVIKAVQAVVMHGKGQTSTARTGEISILSNPASASVRTFDFGDDKNAVGTDPLRWQGAKSIVTENPTVTLGTAPVVRLTKTINTTDEVNAEFLGIYVFYTAVPPASPGRRALLGVGV
jgi:hypothetical protein